MNKSDQINELAAALAKAQGQIHPAIKDAKNPHYGSKFADLTSVWDAAREPLSINGLSVSQVIGASGEGLALTTMLIHSSGQWLSSELPLVLTKRDMQGLGSAITYARRYALSAIVGITQDDDDGESAVGRDAPVKSPARAQTESNLAGNGNTTPKNGTVWAGTYKQRDMNKMNKVELDDLIRLLEATPRPSPEQLQDLDRARELAFSLGQLEPSLMDFEQAPASPVIKARR